jgi:tRNA pseudouridine65 synthase
MHLPFRVLYEDNSLIAIDKPSGILVHRTRISEDKTSVLQQLRDQVGRRLFPVHRLDRGTSGVLLLAKTAAAAASLGAQFRTQAVNKTYQAIIRGYVEAEAEIDYALTNESGTTLNPAITRYRRLKQAEYSHPVGRYPTARYAWVEIVPQTGRFHQIRRHFSHIRHPVIGDKKHGDLHHNRFFREAWGIDRLLLHATALRFQTPEGTLIEITSPPNGGFKEALTRLDW